MSDLVSVPFQFNWEQQVGPENLTRFVLHVQPVVPFSLNEKWNLIARVIMPYLSQPPLAAGGSPASGLADITASAFVSPSNSGGVTWGVGPAMVLPATNEPTLGSGKWSLGPTLVILKQQGPLTYGVLWNQVWSIGGDANRPAVNQMFLQPFFAYTTSNLITYTLQSETIGNWQSSSNHWTVPVNVIVAKLLSFGPFPASYQIGAGYFLASPQPSGASWKLRAAMVILLPRSRR